MKTTNLIFNEHNKLLQESKIYQSQIEDYKKVINNYQTIDSIRNVQIDEYAIEVNKVNKQLKKSNKIHHAIIGGLSIVSIVSILLNILR